MSIKADVLELQSIRAEIKRLGAERKLLVAKEKKVVERIQEYLRVKEQPGLKHQGTAILLEEKEARERKKPKESERDSLQVLEQYGIREPEKVLKELAEARKGNPYLKSKLKIKKYKDPHNY